MREAIAPTLALCRCKGFANVRLTWVWDSGRSIEMAGGESFQEVVSSNVTARDTPPVQLKSINNLR